MRLRSPDFASFRYPHVHKMRRGCTDAKYMGVCIWRQLRRDFSEYGKIVAAAFHQLYPIYFIYFVPESTLIYSPHCTFSFIKYGAYLHNQTMTWKGNRCRPESVPPKALQHAAEREPETKKKIVRQSSDLHVCIPAQNLPRGCTNNGSTLTRYCLFPSYSAWSTSLRDRRSS